ncbi:MAG: putative ABC transport system permease protein [Paraglaciecola sp.]|jgi:putative ABC transport system permease protein
MAKLLFRYYLRLALLSIQRTPILSGLTIATIALGIAACAIMMTLLYLMSADPIPQKSEILYRVQLDSWDANQAAIEPNLPPDDVTWTEANAIVAAKQAFRQTASAITWGMVTPEDKQANPFLGVMRVTHSDFFAMFATPFLFGGGWDKEADRSGQFVTVLSRATNEKVFGGTNSVGEILPMLGKNFTVVGVLDDWHPSPKYYDMVYGAFSDPEEIYLPFLLKERLELPHGGITTCWKPPQGDEYSAFLTSECTNFQLWVELRTQAEKTQFEDYLNSYVIQQKRFGRFPRPLNNKLSNVREWLIYKQVVNGDVRVMFWLSILFLFVCLLNAANLIGAKLSTKTAEIGLRRALGANHRAVFSQFILETTCIGLAGGVLGLLLAMFGLQGLKQLYAGYGQLVALDIPLIIAIICLAVISSIGAGLIPIWLACRPAPAFQLKQS